ncbi:Zn(II)2Cys6 transcription factor [Aspergillus sclerotioniger CBS 115572]|uniref:Zn(II)2Cys6 transcription factor n=1 Tax=Aspergillus sclerotioniger CBS 115572 TaxID=1450535 RepID=A0A317X916_9EURO|nr:Zn(II)2Cys6 transcription factor [Aspergillus sclerotioniger CBS 115572]PWY93050.1 Zn(II)2Cys6 transcription factor [Aspergillus sclerotioniger CBS 115572]
MPLTSRPVKLACLACRASKTRCDGQNPCTNCLNHQQECRYRPSRRGGARRGAAAAEELAMKRAERLLNESRMKTHADALDVDSEAYHPHLQTDTTVPVSLLSPSSIESGPRRFGRALEDSGTGLPSPLSGITETQELLGIGELPARSLRAYRCDQDLINAYYVFIHPYFPLLPPPALPQYEDRFEKLRIRSPDANASRLPYWPTSSLGLALAAMLALIPPPGDVHAADGEAVTLRRSYADLYARSALESSEDSLESSSPIDLAKGPQSTLHPGIPRKMEPVLALGLLSMYECCQRRNIAKMRIRANQALTMAMDLSLHTQKSPTDCFDACRRCWWGTIFLVYQSSIITASPPLITCDDLRITTPLPEFRGCREPWPLLMNAQVVLLRSCFIGRQLIREDNGNNQGLLSSLEYEVKHLDSSILELAAEAARYRCVANCQGTEADAERNLWAISNALLHSARLTLHRVRAFPDPPMIFSKQCDFLPNSAVPFFSHHIQLSPGRISEINTLFPFTEQESIRICLQSSLVVSRVFRRLASPNPTYSDAADTETSVSWAFRRLGTPRSIPYMACAELQSFYGLAMVLWRVRAAFYAGNLNSVYYLLDRASAQTEVQDAERLMEELQSGMEALRASIRADFVFEGVGLMAKECDAVYEATTMDA